MKLWKSSEEVRSEALKLAEAHWDWSRKAAVKSGLAAGDVPNITFLGLDLLMQLFAETIRRQELRTQVEALEQRIDAMAEESKNFVYRGVWERDLEYRVGNFVTDGGNVWHCKRATTQRPGDSPSWQLCVKKGRDGRDGRP